MASDLSYNLGLSTEGIIYNGEDGFPRFSPRDGQTLPLGLPPGINQPINICSCSHGLIVYHDPISNIYHIGNPQSPDSYVTLPQTPRPHDPQHTHVVLATEILDQPIYQLICAIEDPTPPTYSFDMYISSTGRWLSYTGLHAGGRIIPNTGISCDAYAYWLTESPRSIFRCNAYFPLAARVRFPHGMIPSAPETRIQLGRIWNEVAVVSVSVKGSSRFVVNVCSFKNGNRPQWHRFSTELANPSGSIPRPVRFDSYFKEVFFWANGRLMHWRNIGQTDSLSVLNEEGVLAADGFAFIFSTLRPQDFPVTFQLNDRQR